MLCQSCNKVPATVHVTQMSKGKQKQEMHLCDACAKQQGVGHKPAISFSELLSGFIEPHAESQKASKKPCPECGITYTVFRDVGRLGCAHDYEVFKRALTSLMDRLHHSSQHVGKIPSRAGHAVAHDAELKDFQEQLKAAVRTENYELAAEIRDKIAAHKEKNSD